MRLEYWQLALWFHRVIIISITSHQYISGVLSAFLVFLFFILRLIIQAPHAAITAPASQRGVLKLSSVSFIRRQSNHAHDGMLSSWAIAWIKKELLFGMNPVRMMMSRACKRFVAECYGHNQYHKTHKCFMMFIIVLILSNLAPSLEIIIVNILRMFWNYILPLRGSRIMQLRALLNTAVHHSSSI